MRRCILTDPNFVEALSTLVSGQGHHCAECISPLIRTCKMEEVVIHTLRNRPWPLCCTSADIRMIQREDEEFRWPLSVRWQATFDEIGIVKVTPRKAASNRMENRRGTETIQSRREVLAFLQNIFGFPTHFVNLVTAHGDRQGILRPGEVLEDARGWVRIRISAARGCPIAMIQLIPPKDGVLRRLRINIVGRSRVNIIVNPTCLACFHSLPHADDRRVCQACMLQPLCFRCVPSTVQNLCIFCVTANDIGIEASLLRVRQFWFEAGARYSRRKYEFPPYAQIPIADAQWEI